MNDKKLPLFGVGPIYVILIISLTILTIILSTNNIISKISIINDVAAYIVGFIVIVIGITLWINAVVIGKLFKNINDNKLVTTGVYSYVRNPIYSAFLFVCTGIIIMLNNIYLIIFPLLYWLILTILMINTEEKWLRNIYKEEYNDYCKKVNRCIPIKKRKREIK